MHNYDTPTGIESDSYNINVISDSQAYKGRFEKKNVMTKKVGLQIVYRSKHFIHTEKQNKNKK